MEIIDKVCNLRNPTDFWQAIRRWNALRYTRNPIDIDVCLECYRQVFDVPYLGVDLSNRRTFNQELDRNITLEELNLVLQELHGWEIFWYRWKEKTADYWEFSEQNISLSEIIREKQ